jgi:glycosyltransferase involved in cell wall biosynthesis
VPKSASRNKKHTNKHRNINSAGIDTKGNSGAVPTDYSRPARILWNSNAPFAGTGYGQQTAQVIKRLAKEGHQVAVSCNYGIEAAMSEWEGFTLYPRGMDVWSNDVVPANAFNWFQVEPTAPQLLITLFDTWIYKGDSYDKVNRIASWVPIDHMPLPLEVRKWCIRPNVTPIAMSRFGQKMLEHAGLRDVIYVPHGIESNQFKPTNSYVTDNGSMSAEQLTKISDDKFMVLMVAANKGQAPVRKSFPEAFLAFAKFAQDKPDAVLFCYTEDKGAMTGINLRTLAEGCGLKPHQIEFINQYAYRQGLPQAALATIYTRANVLLMPSMGEGFGIPAIEAQMCGLPVIVSNFSAQPELVGDGWAVNGQPFWSPAHGAWLQTPNVPEIVNALNEAYERPREISQKAIDFAAQYDADVVFEEHWKPALERLL